MRFLLDTNICVLFLRGKLIQASISSKSLENSMKIFFFAKNRKPDLRKLQME